MAPASRFCLKRPFLNSSPGAKVTIEFRDISSPFDVDVVEDGTDCKGTRDKLIVSLPLLCYTAGKQGTDRWGPRVRFVWRGS